jgi:ECF transporter S component (folate family)
LRKKTTFVEDLAAFGKIRVLTLSAMLIAMSVIIGYFCKNFLTFNVYYRITFENLPVIFAGVLFGPFVGAVVGFVSDAVSCLISSNPNINPIISVGAILVGFTSGLVSHHITLKNDNVRLITSVALAHLFGQVIVKSIGKILWYGMPWWGVFLGLGTSIIVGTLEFFAIRALLNNYGIRKDINKI